MPKEAVVYYLTLVFQHLPEGNDNHDFSQLVQMGSQPRHEPGSSHFRSSFTLFNGRILVTTEVLTAV
jgi:hypothetical protein